MIIPFVQMARELLANGWGREFPSAQEAAKHAADKMDPTGAILLELLRRLDRLGKAIADPSPDPDNEKDKRPEWAAPLPGVKVGDVLYSCSDIEDGAFELVVCTVTEGDFFRVVFTGSERKKVYPCWGTDNYARSSSEALRREAKNDLKYHGARVRLAQKILDAVDAGGDLSRFVAGVDLNEEAEEE